MLAPNSSDLMNILIEKGMCSDFSVKLTKENMEGYYQAHGIKWSDCDYLSFCVDKLNFRISVGGEQIGLVVLSISNQVCSILDLQVKQEYQGKGIGSFCLEYIFKLAAQNDCAWLKLGVFTDNPAVNLYKRFGFIVHSKGGGLLKMEKPVTSLINSGY